MVIQILRFVSPRPWGSHTAEAFRKSASLDRIVTSLFGNTSDDTSKRFTFSAGSHVLWTPVYVRSDGQLKHMKPAIGTNGWADAWLASRLSPYKSAYGHSVLEIDVTSLILDMKTSVDPIEVLYDNRFVLSFDLRAIPNGVFERLGTSSDEHRLVIAATKKYFLPRLVFRTSNGSAVEDVSVSGPSSCVPANVISGTYGSLSGTSWASWRLARAFE